MSTVFAIGCIGCAVIGYTLGWRDRDRQKTKRSDDLRELKMMLRSHVEASDTETMARKARAA